MSADAPDGRERSELPAAERGDDGLPRPIARDFGMSVGDLWRERINRVVWETYAGIPLVKFPEDLRVYEHLLWLSAPSVAIELGTHAGGGALWLRDRMRALRDYGRIDELRVITVDLDVELARESLDGADPGWGDEIELLAGDVLDPALPGRVGELVPAGASCIVIEDSAHTGETTAAALRGFARFVQAGGFMVIEDTCADFEEMRVYDFWPRGPIPAIDAWLETDEGREFTRREDLELYGITCHPGGYLQRRG
jgi:cephalosporin hydroxylase